MASKPIRTNIARQAESAIAAPRADAPKTVFKLSYSIHQRGHTSEVRDVIIAASRMSDAILHVEEQGGSVLSASAVMDGAAFISL